MSDDAPLRNMMRSARKPGPNDRVVEVNKPLGLVLEEDERGNVYVKQVQRGGNAARVSETGHTQVSWLYLRTPPLQLGLRTCPFPPQSGKIEEGDLISMISATFGDEMWSARGAGLGMIMQAIKVCDVSPQDHVGATMPWLAASKSTRHLECSLVPSLCADYFPPESLPHPQTQVRQGTTVKLVLEATGEAAKKKQRAATAQASKAKAAEDAAKVGPVLSFSCGATGG
jgi:hypothetical protein